MKPELVYMDEPRHFERKILTLAVHPLHNPEKLFEAYSPLVDFLNNEFDDYDFRLEASADYHDYEDKIRMRKPDLLLPNPWQTLLAMELRYSVIATAGDADDFRGIFIVRTDSSIEVMDDLRGGKKVSYPSPTALAACIMPQMYLHDHGIDVNSDIENIFVGSQESSILNALLRDSDVAVTWPPPWRLFQRDRPIDAQQLKVIWKTPSLINNSVMVKDELYPLLGKRIQHALVRLSSSEEGEEILKGMATSNFLVADNDDYEIVRTFIQKFEAEVRRVDDH